MLQNQVAEVAEVTLSNSNDSKWLKKNLGNKITKIDITNGGISQKFGKQFGLAKKAMKDLGKSKDRNSD